MRGRAWVYRKKNSRPIALALRVPQRKPRRPAFPAAAGTGSAGGGRASGGQVGAPRWPRAPRPRPSRRGPEATLRGPELEVVALQRQLLRRPLAARVVELAKLEEERVAFAFEVAASQGAAFGRGRLRRAGAAQHAPHEDRAENEARGQDEEGRGPVDRDGAVHGPSGALPPGQPYAISRTRRTAAARRSSSGRVSRPGRARGEAEAPWRGGGTAKGQGHDRAAQPGDRRGGPATRASSRRAAGAAGGRTRRRSARSRPAPGLPCSPRATRPRTSAFMFWAMVAGESATDRPWQTGQRKRLAMSSVRASSAAPSRGAPLGGPTTKAGSAPPVVAAGAWAGASCARPAAGASKAPRRGAGGPRRRARASPSPRLGLRHQARDGLRDRGDPRTSPRCGPRRPGSRSRARRRRHRRWRCGRPRRGATGRRCPAPGGRPAPATVSSS